jgi:hypothetical protein
MAPIFRNGFLFCILSLCFWQEVSGIVIDVDNQGKFTQNFLMSLFGIIISALVCCEAHKLDFLVT